MAFRTFRSAIRRYCEWCTGILAVVQFHQVIVISIALRIQRSFAVAIDTPAHGKR
jgi:hypothetical protein